MAWPILPATNCAFPVTVARAALLVLVTWLVRRFVLDRLSPRGRIGVVSALVVCLLGATSFTPLYDSQFHHESAHARLWELYR